MSFDVDPATNDRIREELAPVLPLCASLAASLVRAGVSSKDPTVAALRNAAIANRVKSKLHKVAFVNEECRTIVVGLVCDAVVRRRLADGLSILLIENRQFLIFLKHKVRNDDLAEELLQEANLRVLRGIIERRLRFTTSAEQYLFGVLRHLVIDHFRRVKRTIPFSDLPAGVEFTAETQDLDLKWATVPASELHDAWAKLTDTEREALEFDMLDLGPQADEDTNHRKRVSRGWTRMRLVLAEHLDQATLFEALASTAATKMTRLARNAWSHTTREGLLDWLLPRGPHDEVSRKAAERLRSLAEWAEDAEAVRILDSYLSQDDSASA
jgi:DNA-directed RNA polymerase specialized sigma24 family protein